MNAHQDDDIIEVGDLVAVIAGTPCCGANGCIGDVRTVLSIKLQVPSDDDIICMTCGKSLPVGTPVYYIEKNGGHIRSQLKKIKPPPKQLPAKVKEKELT